MYWRINGSATEVYQSSLLSEIEQIAGESRIYQSVQQRRLSHIWLIDQQYLKVLQVASCSDTSYASK